MLDPSVVARLPLELVVHPLLLHPHIGNHNLPFHVDPNDLREFQAHLHSQAVGAVPDRSDQSGKKVNSFLLLSLQLSAWA